MREITDKTLIPLGLAILSIGGAAAWATTVNNRIEQITRVVTLQEQYAHDVNEIKIELAEIKSELKRQRR